METRKFADYMMRVGCFGAVLLFAYGIYFYIQVAKALGSSPQDQAELAKCLLWDSQPCMIIKGLARLAGYWTYEPALLYLLIAAYVAGIILKLGYAAQDAVQHVANGFQRQPLVENIQDTAVAPAPVNSDSQYDRAKWNALVQYDDDIARFADKIRPLGQKWEDQFASAYLALNDKAYLEPIARKLHQQASAERMKHQEGELQNSPQFRTERQIRI